MARNSELARKALRDIARHPSAEPGMIICAADPDARHWAAAHPSLPAETLCALLEDPDPESGKPQPLTRPFHPTRYGT